MNTELHNLENQLVEIELAIIRSRYNVPLKDEKMIRMSPKLCAMKSDCMQAIAKVRAYDNHNNN